MRDSTNRKWRLRTMKNICPEREKGGEPVEEEMKRQGEVYA